MYKSKQKKQVGMDNKMVDPLLFGLLCGQLTEELVRSKLAKRIPEGHELIDGHEPFETENFKACEASKGARPSNLDLVQIDGSGNVAAIYEVKSTDNEKRSEFNVNGQCGTFMNLADSLSIPTFVAVVRLDRQIRRDVLNEDRQTKEVTINSEVYSLEIEHFLEAAKFELYNKSQFRIDAGRFILSGEPQVL